MRLVVLPLCMATLQAGHMQLHMANDDDRSSLSSRLARLKQSAAVSNHPSMAPLLSRHMRSTCTMKRRSQEVVTM